MITSYTHTHTHTYDKRDDFAFPINNFPHLSSNIHNNRTYNVLLSQLIRFCRICQQVSTFIKVTKTLIKKLLSRTFKIEKLKKKFIYFYNKYKDLLEKYKQNNLKFYIDKIFY